MSNEGSYPSCSPHGSVASPLTYSFSSMQEYPLLHSPSIAEYSNLTQLSQGYYNSPTLPTSRGQSPWTAHPASGPSSGGYHPTSSFSPTIPTAPLHVASYHSSPTHVPQGIAHKTTSSQKQESKFNERTRDFPARKVTRQKPPKEACLTSSANPQEQEQDARPRNNSDKPATELEQSTTAAKVAHSKHTSTDKRQRPRAQPTAQQGMYRSTHVSQLRSVDEHTHPPTHTHT